MSRALFLPVKIADTKKFYKQMYLQFQGKAS